MNSLRQRIEKTHEEMQKVVDECLSFAHVNQHRVIDLVELVVEYQNDHPEVSHEEALREVQEQLLKSLRNLRKSIRVKYNRILEL